MWNYSEKVKDHFFNPRNAKALEDANAIGEVGSISCGDALKLMLKVNEQTEIIEDAGFQTFGCGSAIASSSALTELIIGKTVNDAATLSNQEIVDYLGGLPPEKMHCSVMGQEALEAAVANYRGIELEADDHEEGKLICRCFAVDEGKISRAVEKHGLTTIEEVINYTKAGGACSSCHENIEQVIDTVVAAKNKATAHQATKSAIGAALQAPAKVGTVPAEGGTLTQKVAEILESLRPNLQADGGDVSLVEASEHLIIVCLSGACVGCMMTDMTLAFLQQQITEQIGVTIPVVNQIAAQPEGILSEEPAELSQLRPAALTD